MGNDRAARLLLSVLSCFFFTLRPGNCETRITVPNIESDIYPQKFENGLEIFWRDDPVLPSNANSTDKHRDAVVEIFDRAGTQLAICLVKDYLKTNDSRLLDVGLWDVSARRPGYIAVAAVYTRIGADPVAVLLYFNWDGAMRRETVLDARSEIHALELDRQGHVWTLNEFDPDNLAESVFSEFNDSGALMGQFVKPQRHWTTDESDTKGGQTSFGVMPGGAWAWLPVSRTLVSIDEGTAKAEVHRTGFPHIAGGRRMEARRAVLLPNGQLLMDVAWTAGHQRDGRWFLWSARSGWKGLAFPPEQDRAYLYGADGDEAIYSSTRGVGSSATFETERMTELLARSLRHEQ